MLTNKTLGFLMKKHIFIVDDDEAILDVIKIILEDNGYKTTVIPDASSLIRKIGAAHPDLILLDIWLTGTDGISIAKKIKINEKLKKIPIIMISANNQGKQIAIQNGADGFIAKPFEIDELLNVVNRHLYH